MKNAIIIMEIKVTFFNIVLRFIAFILCLLNSLASSPLLIFTPPVFFT